MTIGGGDRIDSFFARVGDHVKEIWIDVWLSLKIENEVNELSVIFVYDLAKEVALQVARRASEGSQPAGAFRATQITSGSRLNTNGKWHTPHYWPLQISGDKIRQHYLGGIPTTGRGQFTDEV